MFRENVSNLKMGVYWHDVDPLVSTCFVQPIHRNTVGTIDVPHCRTPAFLVYFDTGMIAFGNDKWNFLDSHKVFCLGFPKSLRNHVLLWFWCKKFENAFPKVQYRQTFISQSGIECDYFRFGG